MGCQLRSLAAADEISEYKDVKFIDPQTGEGLKVRCCLTSCFIEMIVSVRQPKKTGKKTRGIKIHSLIVPPVFSFHFFKIRRQIPLEAKSLGLIHNHRCHIKIALHNNDNHCIQLHMVINTQRHLL